MTYDPRRENLFDQCKTLVQLNAVTPLPTRDDRDDIVRELCEALDDLHNFVLTKFAWAAEDEASENCESGDDMCVDCRECGCINEKLRCAAAALRRARGQQ